MPTVTVYEQTRKRWNLDTGDIVSRAFNLWLFANRVRCGEPPHAVLADIWDEPETEPFIPLPGVVAGVEDMNDMDPLAGLTWVKNIERTDEAAMDEAFGQGYYLSKAFVDPPFATDAEYGAYPLIGVYTRTG